MIRRLFEGLNKWSGTVALFLVLTGGTAMAVDGSLPGQNTVGSADIINGEVASVDIGAGQVAGAELAANSVNAAKIGDGEVRAADIGANAVASKEVADDSLTGTDILNGSLTSADLAKHTLQRDDLAFELKEPLTAAVRKTGRVDPRQRGDERDKPGFIDGFYVVHFAGVDTLHCVPQATIMNAQHRASQRRDLALGAGPVERPGLRLHVGQRRVRRGAAGGLRSVASS